MKTTQLTMTQKREYLWWAFTMGRMPGVTREAFLAGLARMYDAEKAKVGA